MKVFRRVSAPLAVMTLLGGLLLVGGGQATAATATHAGTHPGSARHDPRVSLDRIGGPSWTPAGFQLFSAPIGTEASGYAEFGETQLALLPAPNHVPNAALGVGPGRPHRPPYQFELANGVRAQGFDTGHVFRVSDFSRGNGIWLVWMDVPGARAAIGSSPDFRRGRIVSNAIFPIHVSGASTHRGGRVLLTEFDIPSLNAITPPFNVDGHSHFPVFIADNADFWPADFNPLGSYTWTFRMIDRNGNGWQISTRFEVRR